MDQTDNFIFGIHPILEAIEGNKKIEKVLFRQGFDGPQFHMLLDKLREKNIQVQFVPYEKLNALTRSNHQGVIAFMAIVEYISLEDLTEKAEKSGTPPLVLILDGISDIRNFGAIARSAECAGAQGIILPAKGSAAINADSVKTSAGALMRIPVCKVSNIREAIYFLKQCGYSVVSASERASQNIYEADFKGATAIILGSEEKGVSSSALSLSDSQVRIPMNGSIGSLNVSSAAAVILFEAVRQRFV
ncbi:MAG: 23S rRNA (guanosine(2251)-2'-O)-methyltransferase RlmB [Bacteroidales bacterium]|jgi:23S rRNA (guanosine2251-2'-O)-methyltransferase|nr:23S rRNA (guanosine(2251)-2'-O)-methyltransferase RlmB [Bacteroidales bacterium]